jgi:outer membrane murein-binding lipoprotein Lpp
MNKLLLCVFAGGLLAGCSKRRIAECDKLVATAQKVAKCDKLPDEVRKSAADAAKSMEESLKRLDDFGGVAEAPKDLVDQMQDLCRNGTKNFVDEYTKLMPECMK